MFEKILKMKLWKLIVTIVFFLFLLGVGVQVYIMSHFIGRAHQLVRVFEEEAKEDIEDRKRQEERDAYEKKEYERKEMEREKERLEQIEKEKEEQILKEKAEVKLKERQKEYQINACRDYKQIQKRIDDHTMSPSDLFDKQFIERNAEKGWFDMEACMGGAKK